MNSLISKGIIIAFILTFMSTLLSVYANDSNRTRSYNLEIKYKTNLSPNYTSYYHPVEYGTQIGIPSLDITGYDVVGYFTEPEFITEYDMYQIYNSNSDTTVYAKLEPKEYTLSVHNVTLHGIDVTTYNFLYESEYNLIKNPRRPQHSFLHYEYVDEYGNSEIFPDTGIYSYPHDLEVYALFEINMVDMELSTIMPRFINSPNPKISFTPTKRQATTLPWPSEKSKSPYFLFQPFPIPEPPEEPYLIICINNGRYVKEVSNFDTPIEIPHNALDKYRDNKISLFYSGDDEMWGGYKTFSVRVGDYDATSSTTETTTETSSETTTTETTTETSSETTTTSSTTETTTETSTTETTTTETTTTETSSETSTTETSTTETSYPSFLDMNNHWAEDYINYLVELEILKDFDGKTFKPDTPIKRQDASLIITNLLNHLDIHLGITQPIQQFSDIPAGAYYYDSVISLAQHNIIKGYGNNLFKPTNNITREEAICILDRLIQKGLIIIKSSKPSPTPIDINTVSHWAKDSVTNALNKGLVRGDNNQKINPTNTITRAEFCAIIYNILTSIS